ncbi:MAG: hypothetical protein JXB48_05845 [Candidatus Latescibacteria bacterium]|nr:hypothetical protein [Candidatus Latescibacterota bacterium]
MAKKKQRQTVKHSNTPISGNTSSFAELISGDKAKWIFFAVYFIATIILFRSFLFNDVMLFGSDTIPDGIYTRQYYKDFHAQFGGIPKWNPLILGGMPFIDAMHGDTFYPGAWLKFFMPLTRALGHKLVWHVFLAGVFMYIFLRTLKVRREAAFLGGLMYMLAPSFVTLLYSGHDAKMYVIAFLPLAFALLESGMNKPKYYTFAGLGAVMGLLILTSHIQMAYYSYWALGLYFFFRLFFSPEETRNKKAIKTAFFGAAVIIAVMLGAVQLFPSYKFTTSQSVRSGEERTGYDYATSWAMHPEEAMGMVIPAFPGFEGGIGNLTKTTYWGRNPFKLNTEYHGILPILLAALALLTYRNRRMYFFLGLALLSLIYSLGATTPIYRLFYALVPGIKNFRAPSMMIFLFLFSACVMAASYLGSFFERKTTFKSGDKRILYAVGGLIVITLFSSLAANGLFDIWRNTVYRDISDSRIEEYHRAASMQGSEQSTVVMMYRNAESAKTTMKDNIPSVIRDMWKALLFVTVCLLGLWMFLSQKIGIPALVVLVGLIAFVDETIVNSRFIKVLDPSTNNAIAPGAEVSEIKSKMADRKPFRILGLIMQAARMRSPNYYAMFGIQAADGHHNNELQSYELYTGGRSMPNYLSLWLGNNEFNPEKIIDNNFLKIAGVRYIPFPTNSGIELLENPSGLDRARIVYGSIVEPNDTLAVEMLKDSTFDPAKIVIIDKGNELPVQQTESDTILARVENITYTKSGIEIIAGSAKPGYLVLSENFVPYWKAYIDKQQVEISKAYGTFMAIPFPEGNYEVTFEFRSGPYATGKKMTLTALLIVVVALAVPGVQYALKKK